MFKRPQLIQTEKEYKQTTEDHPFFDDLEDDDISEFEDMYSDDELFND